MSVFTLHVIFYFICSAVCHLFLKVKQSIKPNHELFNSMVNPYLVIWIPVFNWGLFIKSLIGFATNYRIATLDCIIRGLGFFDSWGLKHSLKHLLAVDKKIVFWDVSIQSKYADIVTTAICKNSYKKRSKLSWIDLSEIDNIRNSIIDDNPDTWFNHTTNATAIGNLAHISLHFNNKIVRDKARLMLLTYKKYLSGYK